MFFDSGVRSGQSHALSPPDMLSRGGIPLSADRREQPQASPRAAKRPGGEGSLRKLCRRIGEVLQTISSLIISNGQRPEVVVHVLAACSFSSQGSPTGLLVGAEEGDRHSHSISLGNSTVSVTVQKSLALDDRISSPEVAPVLQHDPHVFFAGRGGSTTTFLRQAKDIPPLFARRDGNPFCTMAPGGTARGRLSCMSGRDASALRTSLGNRAANSSGSNPTTSRARTAAGRPPRKPIRHTSTYSDTVSVYRSLCGVAMHTSSEPVHPRRHRSWTQSSSG